MKEYKVLCGLAQFEADDGTGRVKSYQPNSGLKPPLGCNPAAAHCDGLVNPGTGFPFASTQGELSVGLTIPKASFSLRKVCSYMTPAFTLWMPFVIVNVREAAGIGSRRFLRARFRLNGPKSANGLGLG